jgi:hypothetical protein
MAAGNSRGRIGMSASKSRRFYEITFIERRSYPKGGRKNEKIL